MSLTEARLGNLVIFQRGFDITKNEQTDGGIPVVSSGGISSYHNTYKAVGPGVIIGRKGTLGTVHYVESNYWPHDTTLWVKDFKGNDPKFIYYFLQTLRLERFDSGASNPTLNRNHIHKLRVTVPEQKSREKIASILSAYDELIENNNQRIALLEQMAEEIYKEWFVRLRFPGHQNTKIVDGVPEGWEELKIGKIIKFVKGKNPEEIESNPLEGYVNYLNLESLEGDVNIFVPIKSHVHVDLFNIIMVMDGARSSLVFIGKKGAVGNTLAKLELKKHYEQMSPLIYFYLRLNNKALVANNTGSAIPHANKAFINRLKILAPSEKILVQSSEQFQNIVELISNLEAKNKLLKQTRDLLLPRLISGKLSVEHLMDEPIPEAVSV